MFEYVLNVLVHYECGIEVSVELVCIYVGAWAQANPVFLCAPTFYNCEGLTKFIIVDS